jgi:small subunit ribosomal protein S9
MASNRYPQVGVRGTGRRKEAVARVRLIPGTGQIVVNGKKMEEYFGARRALHLPILQPLTALGVQERYNVVIRTEGGGPAGQAQAIRMGMARALAEINPDNKVQMRAEGFLTRDARVKERKKYGRKRARKRFQFSKR